MCVELNEYPPTDQRNPTSSSSPRERTSTTRSSLNVGAGPSGIQKRSDDSQANSAISIDCPGQSTIGKYRSEV